jgi:3-hydroxyacyl-CoA dehydrogenase
MNQNITPAVTISRTGSILVAEIDHPPVNALSQAVRAGLIAALDQLDAEVGLAALVVAARGRIYSGGADVTEFGGAMHPPFLGEVIDRLDAGRKPVVAAIHGSALGGGLEIALACNARIACASARFALPEVKLGILPGSGGVVRLPRLVGLELALSMIAEGRQLGAAEALEAGLVDRIAQDDELLAAAIVFAQELAASGVRPRRASEIPFPSFDAAAQDEARKALAKKYRGLEAPQKAVELFAMAAETPFGDAVRQEYAACKALLSSPQSRALRYLFAAERAAAKLTAIPEGTAARDIRRAGIVGPGTMGRGITIAFLDAGLPVTLVGLSEESLDAARKAISKTYENGVKRGKLSEPQVAERLSLLTTTISIEALADADIVIESIIEDLAAKQAVIARIDRAVGNQAIIATNTSFLGIDVLSASTTRPANFAGMHFFNPANLMKLVENVHTGRTAPDVLLTLMALSKKLGKTAVLVGPSEGFVANRMLAKRTREALFLLQEGASPEQVDRVLTRFGFPIGPFALADLAGLEVLAATRKARAAGMSPRELGADIAERLVAEGRLGRKNGAGYYAYGEDGKQLADPAVDVILAQHRRERGITARDVSDQEVLERCLYAMVNEGAKLIEERSVARASDIDVVWTSGLAFPHHLGGPMFWASEIGLSTVAGSLNHYAENIGPEYFRPSPLIERLAAAGERFP